MQILLFNRNLSSPSLDTDLTGRVQRLRFSTKLPGGFGMCSFQLKDDYWRGYKFLTGKLLYRLVVTDHNTNVNRDIMLFEGRIEDITLDYGAVSVTAYGYMTNLRDRPYRTAYNATADVVMKSMLTAVCNQINADQTGIDPTDITITSGADETYLDETPLDIMNKLLGFSDSTGATWDWAIWENRKPYLTKRAPSSINWRVSLNDFVRFRLTHRIADLWTRAYGRYQSGGSLSRTSDYIDTTAETKFGDGTNGFIREYAIPDLGAVSSTAAEAARKGWVEKHKTPMANLNDAVLGAYVYDTDGIRYPSSWVRAGQVIRVRDLVPATGDLASTAIDSLRTFFIVETEYDYERRENRLIFDTENPALDAVLARKLKGNNER